MNVNDRDLELLGELRQLGGRTVPDHAVASQDDRPGRLLDKGGGPFHTVPRRRRSADPLPWKGLLVLSRFVLADVLRKFDVGRARLLGFRELERLADDLRDDVRALDPSVPLRDRSEQPQHVDVLVRLPMDLREIRLGRDRDERSPVEEGVRYTGHEIRGSGSQRGEAQSGPAGEAAVHIRHEGGRPLVSRQDEANRAAAQAVHELHVLLSRDPEGETDPFAFEAGDEKFRGVHEAAWTAHRFSSCGPE